MSPALQVDSLPLSHQGSPIMVGKLKSKLKDVNTDCISKLSSLWAGPGSLASWIPLPGTWTVSQSTWAELSYGCGASVCAALAFLFLALPAHSFFCSGFCFLCSLQWKTATTMNLRSEHFAVPTVDTAKGSGHSGLPREAFFQ